MADADALQRVLADGDVWLTPLDVGHVEPLRAVCAEDPAIWEIYPVSMMGEHFDPVMSQRMAGPEWVNFAVFQGQDLVGITGYIRPDAANGVVEIGGTYIAPRVRGTSLNRAMKKLMIDHAFACGFRRIEFRVDERNTRSQTAVLKLGAQCDGRLRRDRITWTGHIRNTCIFSILREEWIG